MHHGFIYLFCGKLAYLVRLLCFDWINLENKALGKLANYLFWVSEGQVSLWYLRRGPRTDLHICPRALKYRKMYTCCHGQIDLCYRFDATL